MEADIFILFYRMTVIIIYGAVVIISIMFTCSIDLYLRVNDLLNSNLLFKKVVTTNVIDKQIGDIDGWLIQYNKVIGPMLFLVGFLDLIMLYKIIDFI